MIEWFILKVPQEKSVLGLHQAWNVVQEVKKKLI